jgi:hypothetical protein
MRQESRGVALKYLWELNAQRHQCAEPPVRCAKGKVRVAGRAEARPIVTPTKVGV